MNIQAWGETWQHRARKRWSDEALTYDLRNGDTFPFRGLWMQGGTMTNYVVPMTSFDMQHASIVTSLLYDSEGENVEPRAGHRITRATTGQVHEVVHREKGRCWKPHGELGTEIEIFVSPMPME